MIGCTEVSEADLQGINRLALEVALTGKIFSSAEAEYTGTIRSESRRRALRTPDRLLGRAGSKLDPSTIRPNYPPRDPGVLTRGRALSS